MYIGLQLSLNKWTKLVVILRSLFGGTVASPEGDIFDLNIYEYVSWFSFEIVIILTAARVRYIQ